MLRLYQAEWCPFSSAVRELLTELGLPFVAIPVEPWPNQRTELGRRSGTTTIPVLEDDDGTLHRGTRAIFTHLRERHGWQHGRDHRERFLEHRPARESDAVGQLVERAELRHDEAAPDGGEPIVRRNDALHRYELWLGERCVGLATYHLSDGRIAFTHTEVLPACEGRGLGSRLVQAALEDAAARGLVVVPLCSFVAAYIERHPELRPLLAAR